METIRPNGAIRNTATYGTIEGVFGGAATYRIDEHLRLVTNDADDAVGLPQEPTRLVRIDENQMNDRICAEVTVGATPCTMVLAVGRRPIEDQDTAIRTGRIHFVTLDTALVDHDGTLEWINQDWAQMSIRYLSVNPEPAQATVSNALVIIGTAAGDGMVILTIDGNMISVPVATGDTPQVISENVAAVVSTKPGLTGEAFRHEMDWLVIVNRGTTVQPVFSITQPTAGGVMMIQPTMTYTGPSDDIELLEGAVLGLNYKAGDDQTIDFFSVDALSVLTVPGGATGFDGLASNLPGWENSAICIAAQLRPNLPHDGHVPGHELGHAIFNVGNPGHSVTATNVFYGGGLIPEPSVDASKRFTSPQDMTARAESGPGSAGPLLLQKN